MWHVGWGEVECVLKVRDNQWLMIYSFLFSAYVFKRLLAITIFFKGAS